MAVAHGVPAESDLDLLPAPLQAGDIDYDQAYRSSFVDMLNDLAAKKRHGQTCKDLKGFTPPMQARLLVPDTLAPWVAELEKDLVKHHVLQTTNPVVAKLPLAAGAFGEQQIQGPRPLVEPEPFSAACIITDGAERSTELKAPKALAALLTDARNALCNGGRSRRGGVLPIFVVGAMGAKLTPDQQALIDKAWAGLGDLRADQPLPIIDVRPAQAGVDDADVTARARRLLYDGLRELEYQVALVQSEQ